MRPEILLAITMLACSSTTVTRVEPDTDAGEEAGGAFGEGGSSGSTTTTGGNAGLEEDGGEIGGEGGLAGSSSGGSGGACVPKTCPTIGVELGGEACGNVSDECGNYIDCGGCDISSNVYNSCGGLPRPNTDGSQDEVIDNICNGGCTEINSNALEYKYACTSGTGIPPEYYRLFICTTDVQTEPHTSGCLKAGEVNTENVTRYKWCCK